LLKICATFWPTDATPVFDIVLDDRGRVVFSCNEAIDTGYQRWGNQTLGLEGCGSADDFSE
jgi:hypothetical protein